MGKFIDLTGKIFGKLVVIKRAEDYIGPRGQHATRWHCRCECGNEVDIVAASLKNGSSKTCGCSRLGRRIKPVNNSILKENYYEVYDDKGNYFTIDIEDYDTVLQYRWWQDNMGYWVTQKDNEKIRLHNFLFNNENGVIDHKDRNRSNNRRKNLRIATLSQNTINKSIQSNNTSGIVGVSWDKKNKKWYSFLTKELKHYFFGRFAILEDAIITRLEAEKKYFGEFAPQRHLFEQYGI